MEYVFEAGIRANYRLLLSLTLRQRGFARLIEKNSCTISCYCMNGFSLSIENGTPMKASGRGKVMGYVFQ